MTAAFNLLKNTLSSSYLNFLDDFYPPPSPMLPFRIYYY